MPLKYYLTLLLLLPLALGFISTEDLSPERQWSQYRGHYSNGILDDADLPVKWDVPQNENIKWKKEIPGLGLSSPVVWGDKLFITTAISEKDSEGLKTGIYGDIGSVNDDSEHEWKVICINKQNGQIIWERTSC
jgi:hypothetical protein